MTFVLSLMRDTSIEEDQAGLVKGPSAGDWSSLRQSHISFLHHPKDVPRSTRKQSADVS
jgi:hypothetical protein